MKLRLFGRSKAPPQDVDTSTAGRTSAASGVPAVPGPHADPAPFDEVIAAVQQSPQDVNVEAHVTVEEKPQLPPDSEGASEHHQFTDPTRLVEVAGAEVERLSKALVGAVRVVPGGLLSTVGVGLLIVTFWTEVVDSTVLGASEFIASVSAAVLMSLVGPIVISRDVGKADRLVESTVGASVESTKQSIRDRAELATARRG